MTKNDIKITAQNYNAYLRYFLGSSQDHILKADLMGSEFSPINAIYLKQVFLDLSLEFSEPERGIILTPSPSRVAVKNDTADKSLKIIRSDLFVQRAKLSNKFHSCKNDAERREVSQAIKFIQAKIASNTDQINHYQQTGEIKQDSAGMMKDKQKPFVIPADPVKLISVRNSHRSTISRYKSNLLGLAKLPNGHKDKIKIPEIEEKLRIKNLELTELIRAVKELKNRK